MRQRIRVTLQFLCYKIGRCSRCIRQSFLVSLFAWSVVALAVAIDSVLAVHIFRPILLIPAVLLSVLWLTHLIVFAMRSAIRPNEPRKASQRGGSHDSAAVSRRSIFATFATSFSGMALATMLPSIASAQNRYWCGPNDYRGVYCSGNQQCCWAYHVSSPFAYCCINGCGPAQDGDCR
jgi:hypothetical protein